MTTEQISTHTPVIDWDSYIDASDTPPSTCIFNMQYDPRIQLEILRNTIPGDTGHILSLPSCSQNKSGSPSKSSQIHQELDVPVYRKESRAELLKIAGIKDLQELLIIQLSQFEILLHLVLALY
ncbi:hypothetical protein WAI453_008751 [Rhynchosporium graminicola]|uniref:Uncharacterized protein n=1 Tax=Rhynchosporium graminicola TaxID=2792576 RepID=A0A1E1KHW9_9HELO|nr:uncharacterized protein RCO7_14452 [Rhynchosporium commune]